MSIAEWDAEKAYQYARKEGMEDGRAEGRAEGISEDRERIASDMLKDNYPLSAIQKISRLSEEAIRNLANSLGITIA